MIHHPQNDYPAGESIVDRAKVSRSVLTTKVIPTVLKCESWGRHDRILFSQHFHRSNGHVRIGCTGSRLAHLAKVRELSGEKK